MSLRTLDEWREYALGLEDELRDMREQRRDLFWQIAEAEEKLKDANRLLDRANKRSNQRLRYAIRLRAKLHGISRHPDYESQRKRADALEREMWAARTEVERLKEFEFMYQSVSK